MEKNEVITLEDRGFIQVKGPEAKDFLQNIVTNDLEKVTNEFTVFSLPKSPDKYHPKKVFSERKRHGNYPRFWARKS